MEMPPPNLIKDLDKWSSQDFASFLEQHFDNTDENHEYVQAVLKTAFDHKITQLRETELDLRTARISEDERKAWYQEACLRINLLEDEKFVLKDELKTLKAETSDLKKDLNATRQNEKKNEKIAKVHAQRLIELLEERQAMMKQLAGVNTDTQEKELDTLREELAAMSLYDGCGHSTT